jgi:hypothetical protein
MQLIAAFPRNVCDTHHNIMGLDCSVYMLFTLYCYKFKVFVVLLNC